MSFAFSSWLNATRSLWEREVVNKLDAHIDPAKEPDPHEQYLLESVAVQVFAFAAYGAMHNAAPVLIGDLDIGWDTVPYDTLSVATPRGVVFSLANNTFQIVNDGVYFIGVSGAIAHNELNAGRVTFMRLFNVTTATPDPVTYRMATGRNSDGTPIAWFALTEVTEAEKGNEYRLEIGGGDSYSGVDITTAFSVYNVGEWREPLPEA